MTTNATAFCVGLLLVGTAAAIVLADDTAMPNPELTPGMAAASDAREVCAVRNGVTYSQSHRKTPYALKDWIFREYGIEPPDRNHRHLWEIDHLIPLCLGGADEAANLWPQPIEGAWGYPVKDKLEAHLCRAVCAGEISLPEAQKDVATDWTAAYRKYMK